MLITEESMIVEDQDPIIAFLADPESHGGTPVDRIDTHISAVFQVGDRALKLKRAVRFPYLDFSTADKRRVACEAEVAVNRRTATDLYRGIAAVKRATNGTLSLEGDGEVVDWVVVMNRFDQNAVFDRLAILDALDRHLLERTAEAIAHFHHEAEATPDFGGRHGMAANIDAYATCFAEAGPGVFDATLVNRIVDDSRRMLDEVSPLLESRRRGGRVRHCHGDLHLRNIVLIDGRPTLFDAIEFSKPIAHIDMLFDLAFLLMDLDHRDRRKDANIVLNRYLDVTADDDGLAALPLFLSERAAIRAHVDGVAAKSQRDPALAEAQRQEARDYLARAVDYVKPPPAALVAIGGLSGTGKSALARALAPSLGAAPGARILRTDILRKRRAGVPLDNKLPAAAYKPETSAPTYGALCADAATVLATGHGVIADGVFARPEERTAIRAVAEARNVPFHGLWLAAPLTVRADRVSARRNDASDADSNTTRMQESYHIGGMDWAAVDASGSPRETVSRARRKLAEGAPGSPGCARHGRPME